MKTLLTRLGVIMMVAALLSGAWAGCTKRQPGHTKQRPRVDRALMACLGARTVNFTPSSAITASVSRSTAVSGSHIPSASRPKRCLKSSRPQRTCCGDPG